MRDVYEVLRSKELEKETLEAQIQALRIVAPLLSDDADSRDGSATVSTRWTTPTRPVPPGSERRSATRTRRLDGKNGSLSVTSTAFNGRGFLASWRTSSERAENGLLKCPGGSDLLPSFRTKSEYDFGRKKGEEVCRGAGTQRRR